MRIQKILAGAGVASRRASEDFLRQGRVSVNGRTAKLGDSADPASDRVELDGERVVGERPAYWLLHKPAGVLTTARDPEGRRTVLQLMPPSASRVFPVGRLDLETEGLLLLTNDGPLAHRLLHPSLGSEREYHVTVKGEVLPRVIERLQRGVVLEDGRTSPAVVRSCRFDPKSGTSTFSLTLSEGRKRQIRRAMRALGHRVTRLVRVRMGPLKLGRLPRGAARPLRDEEIRVLRQHCRDLVRRPKPRAQPGRTTRGRSR